MVCPNCYAAVTPDDEFCGECGHRLKPAQGNSPSLESSLPSAQAASAPGLESSFKEVPPAAPSYLEPGLKTPRKKSRLWIIILIIVLICIASVICAITVGGEFIYDLFNPVIYNGVG
ncbi:MAG: zinc ribbon domain-containing protein [Anaerolineales bacterium]|nr:zinc ribbon domain-containing protein [Anaerolineales bacterium]